MNRNPLAADEREARAIACFLGVAVGDALGLPADLHRSAREPWQRGALWRGTIDLDGQRVSRPLLPFALTLDTGSLTGTDDTENLVVAARCFAAVARDGLVDASQLFDAWRAEFDPDHWAGPAERVAATNAARGQRSPETGRDNPARGDDSALVAGIAAGVLYAGRPDEAARAAETYASIAHADDGVWAAGALAVAVARLVVGDAIDDALTAAEDHVPDDSWTADTIQEVRAAIGEGCDGFAALPDLLTVVGVRDYSHPSLAARSLPAAFALVRLSEGRIDEALPLSLSLARLSDSLPSLVAALCGAAGASLPERWRTRWRGGELGDIDVAAGVLQPTTAGASLTALARQLLTIGADG